MKFNTCDWLWRSKVGDWSNNAVMDNVPCLSGSGLCYIPVQVLEVSIVQSQLQHIGLGSNCLPISKMLLPYAYNIHVLALTWGHLCRFEIWDNIASIHICTAKNAEQRISHGKNAWQMWRGDKLILSFFFSRKTILACNCS